MAQITQPSESQDTNTSVQQLEDLPGKPYDLTIGKKIGKGNYAVVHKGEYQDQVVAVKILTDVLFDNVNEEEQLKQARSIQCFLKELKNLSQLEHKHIVKYVNAFYNGETHEPMLLMEFMSKTLITYLKERKKILTLWKQNSICLQIAEGVKFLHHQQPPLAHRDLTDKNVLVSEDGVVKISDFGQAKLKPEHNRSYFTTGTPGSLAFMPPEAQGDSPHYTESIDVFSLGVLMVEVATQQPPTVTLYGIGFMKECERRQKDIELMGANHPLKPIAVQCMEDNYKHRLRIEEVVKQLSMLEMEHKQEQHPDKENGTEQGDNMFSHPTHVVACREELFQTMTHYIKTAQAFVRHQDSGKDILTAAAADLDKAFKKVAAAKVTASTMGIAGSTLGIVGGGLLLGGVTAPAGIGVLIVGGALGAIGGVTGVGAAVGDVVKNRMALKKANQWTAKYKQLSKALLQRHKRYEEMVSSNSKKYDEKEDACLSTALKGRFGDRGAQFTLQSFRSAHEQAIPVIKQWKAAVETGGQALANGVLAAAETGAAITQAVVTTAEVGAETTGAVTRGVVSGVEATAEVGSAVARTVMIGVGGAVVGLSAVFIVVDLGFLIKTGYNIHKNKGGTKLAKALRRIVEDMHSQAENLRPLANLNQ